MKAEQAEAVALQALGWLVAQDDLRDIFLGSTGARADELAERALDTSFQAAVLEFVLMDDAWVVRFCDALGLPYEMPMRALASLPGQALPHWT